MDVVIKQDCTNSKLKCECIINSIRIFIVATRAMADSEQVFTLLMII